MDSITQKWKDFIDDVCTEKAFLLTPLFSNSQPVNFDGLTLEISTPDDQTTQSLSLHKDYIDKKSKEFFGKKISVQFETLKNSNKKRFPKKNPDHTESSEKTQMEDSYEKIIRDELGGTEITA